MSLDLSEMVLIGCLRSSDAAQFGVRELRAELAGKQNGKPELFDRRVDASRKLTRE